MNMKADTSRRVVGLDAHPDSFTAAILEGASATSACLVKLTDQINLKNFEDWLARNCQPTDKLVMEASGNSFELFTRANALGFEVIILDSKAVGRHADTSWINDKNSAVCVARVFLSGLIRDHVWVPDPITRNRREILGSYQESVKDSTRTTNRIKSFLNEHTIRIPKDMRLDTPKGQQNVFRRKEWTASQILVLKHAFADLSRAQTKQKDLLQHMAEDISKDVLMLSLMRILGIGVVTTYALVAMIGTISRFKNAKKLVSYFGLCPRRKQSGNSDTAKEGKIRNGRKEIRALIIEGANSAMNSKNSPLHRWAWRLAFRKGYTPTKGKHQDTRGRKIAAVATARKILTAVWYLLNGLSFTCADATVMLKRKFAELASLIGKETINEKGFKTYGEFADGLIRNLEAATCIPT